MGKPHDTLGSKGGSGCPLPKMQKKKGHTLYDFWEGGLLRHGAISDEDAVRHGAVSDAVPARAPAGGSPACAWCTAAASAEIAPNPVHIRKVKVSAFIWNADLADFRGWVLLTCH